jgi:hypothetical protein
MLRRLPTPADGIQSIVPTAIENKGKPGNF